MNPYDPLPPRTMSSACACVASDDIECEATARQKLLDWGFDPEDVTKSSKNWYESTLRPSSNIDYGQRMSRPMIIFSHMGDLPMLRYILKKSNDPVGELFKTDQYGPFPLYVAISKGKGENNILRVCRWLCDNGADIKQTVGGDWSPLFRACAFGFVNVSLWLLSSGALLDSNGSFDASIAKRDLPSCWNGNNQAILDRVHRKIFACAAQVIATRSNFLLFLSGTLKLKNKMSPRSAVEHVMVSRGYYAASAVTMLLEDLADGKLGFFLDMAASPLHVFNGQSGILELIGQFVGGIESSRSILTTARGLMEYEKWWDLREPFLERDFVWKYFPCGIAL